MSFRYQLNYFKDENGEYTKPKPFEPSELRELINQNWPNEGFVHELKTIHITDDNNQHLILKNCKRGVFEVYFFRESEHHHFHKKSRLDLAGNCIDLFVNSKFSQLESELNRTTKDRKYLRNELLQDHNYELTANKIKNGLSWTIMGIPIGIMITYIGVRGFFQESQSSLYPMFLPFFILAGLYFWIPGLIIHYQYYKENKNLKISLTKGSKLINLQYNGINYQIDKDEIETVTKIETEIHNRIPWSDYGFTELKLKTGELIILTSLLIDQLFILDKFQHDSVQILKATNNHPFLKQKTTLKR